MGVPSSRTYAICLYSGRPGCVSSTARPSATQCGGTGTIDAGGDGTGPGLSRIVNQKDRPPTNVATTMTAAIQPDRECRGFQAGASMAVADPRVRLRRAWGDNV